MEWPPVTLLAVEGTDGVAAASVRDQKSEYGLVAAWQFPGEQNVSSGESRQCVQVQHVSRSPGQAWLK